MNIIVQGFTFQNGNGPDDGGGAYVESDAASISFQNNIFIGNEATDEGGGFYAIAENGMITLINNVFYNNSTETGYYGGGAYVDSYAGTINVINNTFTGNTSGDYGGGLLVYSNNSDSSVMNIYNNIIWGNTSISEPNGADMYIFDGDNTISNVYNNDYSAFDRAGSGTLNQGGNINQDPLLTGDFHLQPGSLAINTGLNTAPLLPLTDFEGDSRIIDGTVDMGADEYIGQAAAIPTLSEWGMVIFALLLGGSALCYMRRRTVL